MCNNSFKLYTFKLNSWLQILHVSRPCSHPPAALVDVFCSGQFSRIPLWHGLFQPHQELDNSNGIPHLHRVTVTMKMMQIKNAYGMLKGTFEWGNAFTQMYVYSVSPLEALCVSEWMTYVSIP